MDGTPCDAPNLHGRGGGERSGERWLCVAGQCKVWIARGERTTPEINDRYRAGAVRYDQSMRSLLSRALGPSPGATTLSPSFLPVLGFIARPGAIRSDALSINNDLGPFDFVEAPAVWNDGHMYFCLSAVRRNPQSLSLSEMKDFF